MFTLGFLTFLWTLYILAVKLHFQARCFHQLAMKICLTRHYYTVDMYLTQSCAHSWHYLIPFKIFHSLIHSSLNIVNGNWDKIILLDFSSIIILAQVKKYFSTLWGCCFYFSHFILFWRNLTFMLKMVEVSIPFPIS